MTRFSRSHLAGLALTLVLLIATTATGFAHRALPSPDDIARASHALFWGEALVSLCATSDGKLAEPGDCPACQLVGAAVLPGPAAEAKDLALGYSRVVMLPEAAIQVRLALDTAHPVRAPPLA